MKKPGMVESRTTRTSRRAPFAAALAVLGLAAAGGGAPGSAAAEERTPAIVAKAIEHHGGALFEASESSFEIVSKSGAFRVEVRRDGGLYRHAVEADTPEGRRRVEVTNDAVTVTVGGQPRPVPAAEERRWRDHVAARVWFPFLPYGLQNEGIYCHDLGLEEWPADGSPRRLHKVKVTFEPGSSSDADDEYLFWFDPETGRLEQLAYSFDGGLRFRRAKDFRRVGGLLFADHENLGIDEEGRRVDEVTPELVEKEMKPISTIELRDVKVNPIE
ncbi:MAG TPA: DUF6503 family protein [Thermoanaerobaculia bacterium]|nr:DUF6503 family protein [Thermoanaerobaculia bacterium]